MPTLMQTKVTRIAIPILQNGKNTNMNYKNVKTYTTTQTSLESKSKWILKMGLGKKKIAFL